MKQMVRAFLAAAMVLVVAPAFAGTSGRGPAVVVAGSGSCIPIVRLLAEEFRRSHPGMSITVPASVGSAGAITAAAAGTVDIGMVSRPLKTAEAAKGLVYRPFARTALVLAVSSSVPDSDLSYGDIVAIYRGDRSRWKNGRKIVVLTREPGDSAIAVLAEKIPGFREVYDKSHDKKFWATLYTDQEMNQALARARDAIGITDRGAVMVENLPVRMLSLNGVEPLDDNVRSGRYPLAKPLAFVHRKGELSPAATSFLEFVFSARGRTLLKKYGYLPE